MFGNGPYTNETGLCQRECNFPVVPVAELESEFHDPFVRLSQLNSLDIISVEASHERTCWYQVEDQCRVLFIYGFAQDGGKRVRVLNHFICPEPVPVLAISLGVLLALLLLGILAILLYRLYTYVQDRREYARFEEEKKKARWSAVIS